MNWKLSVDFSAIGNAMLALKKEGTGLASGPPIAIQKLSRLLERSSALL